jgi:hypothetical protein
VPDDYPLATKIGQHTPGHFAGVRPLTKSTEILSTYRYRAAAQQFRHLLDVGEWGADCKLSTTRQVKIPKFEQQGLISGETSVQLPVADYQLFSHLGHQSQIL